MLVITSRQAAAFEQELLETFFSRAVHFLRNTVAGIDYGTTDPLSYVRAMYFLARKAGRNTERGVVHFILDKLEHVS